MRYLAATLLSALMAAVCAGGALADPTWKLEQPPPPPGASFSVPLGKPGDLQFLAPNYGLLAVEGNATVPPGLFFYDGAGWHQLSTVCGGPGRTSRIAIASPREFWTITLPSKPRRPAQGTALCHFRDGLVVASYSTQDQSPDPFREMTAAACNGPSDCWFGGIGAEDATGERRGAFHLHWDGTALKTVYAPQGRGVTDIEAHVGGTFFETARIAKFVGENTGQLDLAGARAGAPAAAQDQRRRLRERPVHRRARGGRARRTGPSCWRSTATARRSGPAAAERRRGPPRRRAGWSRVCRSPRSSTGRGGGRSRSSIPRSPAPTASSTSPRCRAPPRRGPPSSASRRRRRRAPSRAWRSWVATARPRSRPCRPAARDAARPRRSPSPGRTRAGW